LKKPKTYGPKPVELYRSQRSATYWPVFLLFSFLAHYAVYGILHEPLRTFVDELPGKKLLLERIVQVQLVQESDKEVPKAEEKIAESPSKPVAPEPAKASPPRQVKQRQPERMAEKQPPATSQVKKIIAKNIPRKEPKREVTRSVKITVTPPPKQQHVDLPAPLPEPVPPPDIDNIKVVDARGKPLENRAVRVTPLDIKLESPSGPEPDDTVMVIKGTEARKVTPGKPEPEEKPVKLAETRTHAIDEVRLNPVTPIETPVRPEFAMFSSAGSLERPSTIKNELLARSTGKVRPNEKIGSIERPAAEPPVPAKTTASSRTESSYDPERPVRDVAALGTVTGEQPNHVPPPLHTASINPAGTFDGARSPGPYTRPVEPVELHGKVPIKLPLFKLEPLSGHSIKGGTPEGTQAPAEEKKPKSAFVLVVELPDVPIPAPTVVIGKPVDDSTDKSVVEVAGTATGNGVSSVMVTVGDITKEILIDNGAFSAEFQLSEGRNVISASAEDSTGRVARDRKVLYYEPSPKGPYLVIAKPENGSVVDTRLTGKVEVLGYVEGNDVGRVALHFNSSTQYVQVENGEFIASLPVSSEHNVLYAEATDAESNTSTSDPVEFRALNVYPKDIIVLVKYDGKSGGVSITHSWKPLQPAENSGVQGDKPDFTDEPVTGGKVVEVEHATPGVYTVGMDYDIDEGEPPVKATFTVIINGRDPVKRKERVIGPVELSGTGHLAAVRLLMPEAVFWEDDNWFSGKIETSDGTTKFRQPEGIIWKEED